MSSSSSDSNNVSDTGIDPTLYPLKRPQYNEFVTLSKPRWQFFEATAAKLIYNAMVANGGKVWRAVSEAEMLAQAELLNMDWNKAKRGITLLLKANELEACTINGILYYKPLTAFAEKFEQGIPYVMKFR